MRNLWIPRTLVPLLGVALLTGASFAALAAAPPAGAAGPVSVEFDFTGDVQTWIVPDDVTSITVDARGAQGGGGGVLLKTDGGLGGEVIATVAVNPGETLQIGVGGVGGEAPGPVSCVLNLAPIAGGFNGGGDGGGRCGGGGGGASDLRGSPGALEDRLVVAGGGGGGSGSELGGGNGGSGGGPAGGDGEERGICAPVANGATAGGPGAGAGDGSAGSGDLGGAGGSSIFNGGGGGGGGLFGGGGGAGLDVLGPDCASGGGGGVGGAFPDATDVALTSGVNTGAGTVTITYSTLEVTPSTLPNATDGSPYSQVFEATGGTAPYTFTFTDGALPDGLDLAADGTLSGTPSVTGTFSFSVTAQDPTGVSGSVDATLTVDAAATTPTTAAGPTLPATGGPSPLAREGLAGGTVALAGFGLVFVTRRRIGESRR